MLKQKEENSMKSNIKVLIVFLGAVICAGCLGLGGLSKDQRAKLINEIRSNPVVCTSESDCKMRWGRAISWIIQNSSLKLQMQTDNVASTYNCVGQSCAQSSFTINMVPIGGGKSRIAFKAGCRNMFGCFPEPLNAEAEFGRYVMQGSSRNQLLKQDR
jgi:hypothetical protein